MNDEINLGDLYLHKISQERNTCLIDTIEEKNIALRGFSCLSLLLMYENGGHISVKDLHKKIYGINIDEVDDGDNTIRANIAYLRKKIEIDRKKPRYLIGSSGYGYYINNMKFDDLINIGDTEVHLDTGVCYRGKEAFTLEPREREVLSLLQENREKPVHKNTFFILFDKSNDYEELLRTYVNSLRGKIDPESNYLVTDRGFGYILV